MFGEIECTNVSDELSKVERKLTEQNEAKMRLMTEVAQAEDRLNKLMQLRLRRLKTDIYNKIGNMFYLVCLIIFVAGLVIEILLHPDSAVGCIIVMNEFIAGVLCVVFNVLAMKTDTEIDEELEVKYGR